MKLLTWLKALTGRKPAEEKAGAAKDIAKATKATSQAELKEGKSVPKARDAVPAEKKKATIGHPPAAISVQRLSHIIRGPQLSEKSVQQAEQGMHTFEVARDATRVEVKAAVERKFNVEVLNVRIANVKAKRKRNGRRASWRKSYVRLAPGQTIEAGEAGA